MIVEDTFIRIALKDFQIQRIKFKKEQKSYKVVAQNERYLICVKPFNLRKTFLYTIVDKKEKMRGPDNMIFGAKHFYDTIEGAKLGLKELESGDIELSYRRSIPLDIEWVK